MKVATLRAFLAVHTWVGLASGLLLFIAFYAGALTMFHHELEGWEQRTMPGQATGHPTEAHDAESDALVAAAAQPVLDQLLAQHPAAAADLCCASAR